MSQRIEHWPDLGYTCVAEQGHGDTNEGKCYFVEWKLYTLYEGRDEKGNPWRGWQRNGAESSPDTVDDIADAEVYAEGSTKWDGCVNWSFLDDSERNTALHACSRRDLIKIGELLGRVHDLCGEMMPETWLDK